MKDSQSSLYAKQNSKLSGCNNKAELSTMAPSAITAELPALISETQLVTSKCMKLPGVGVITTEKLMLVVTLKSCREFVE